MTLCLWMQPDPVSAPHVLSLVDPDQPPHYHLPHPNTAFADNLLGQDPGERTVRMDKKETG